MPIQEKNDYPSGDRGADDSWLKPSAISATQGKDCQAADWIPQGVVAFSRRPDTAWKGGSRTGNAIPGGNIPTIARASNYALEGPPEYGPRRSAAESCEFLKPRAGRINLSRADSACPIQSSPTSIALPRIRVPATATLHRINGISALGSSPGAGIPISMELQANCPCTVPAACSPWRRELCRAHRIAGPGRHGTVRAVRAPRAARKPAGRSACPDAIADWQA